MSAPTIPIDCPRCSRVLYPIHQLRPLPKDSAVTKFGYVFAGVIAAGLYLGSCYWVREVWGWHISARILAFLCIPALIPAIVIAAVFSRAPRIVSLRCSSCGWSERLRLRRRNTNHPTAVRDPAASMAAVSAFRDIPEPPADSISPGEGSPFDEIVDDSQQLAEIKAWIHYEFIAGRSVEEITADLRHQGWPVDDIAIWVEEGRSATRSRRP